VAEDSTPSLDDRLAGTTLLDALVGRRSRRFAPGMRLNGGPLAFESTRPPEPLDLDEQAALAFAACGITGHALAELPYRSGETPEWGGGNIMMTLVGRTVASGDASHADTVFVLDDDGVWLLRRPQDYPPARIPALIELARERRLTELYEEARVRIGDSRVDIPRDVRYMLPLNKWSANRPGTTYFLPIAELTALAINIALILFDDEFSCSIVDERNGFRPAGIGRFRRSKGGHLYDDPGSGRVGTIGTLETLIAEFAAVEQGGIMQNLGLMTQALGLGGFAHYAAHPWIWEQELGFRMTDLPTSRVTGMGPALRLAVRLFRRDLPQPTPVGLERDGEVLIRPYCPPYYRDMRAAVLAFAESKYAAGSGTFRGGAATAWRDPDTVRAGIPEYSDRAIEAACAYCTYVYERYGRFRFYTPEALQRDQTL
jgi:hypothetical protein